MGLVRKSWHRGPCSSRPFQMALVRLVLCLALVLVASAFEEVVPLNDHLMVLMDTNQPAAESPESITGMKAKVSGMEKAIQVKEKKVEQAKKILQREESNKNKAEAKID